MSADAGAVEGGAPALSEFISRFQPLYKDGSTELSGKCFFCEAEGHSFRVGAAGWRCFNCCSQELNGGDAPGFYACWTNTDRAEAVVKLGNGAGLPDAKPIIQVPMRKLPFFGHHWLDKLPGKAVWIHDLSGSVLVWRELLPERAHLGLIEGRPFEHLELLAGRRVVLIPENNPISRVKMQRLAAALYRAGHPKVMWVDMGVHPEFGTRGMPGAGEDPLKWATARSKAYPDPNAAPQEGQSLDAGRAEYSARYQAEPAGAAPNAAPEPEPALTSRLSSDAARGEAQEAAPLTDEELQQALEDAVFPPGFMAGKIAEAEARVAAARAAGEEWAQARKAPPDALERAKAPSKGNGELPDTPEARVAAEGAKAHQALLESVVYTRVADVRLRSVEWLWPGKLPLGMISMLQGDPGLGKSQITASLASIVSNGGQWPVSRETCSLGSVIILSSEDPLEHVIGPRLVAAGADTGRIVVLKMIRDPSGERGFDLSTDLGQLQALVDHLGRDDAPVRLIVIDPVSAYIGSGTDSHKNAEVRGMLRPLSELAERSGAAVLMVNHLTKETGKRALLRGQMSVAFAAVSRAVWGVCPDEDAPKDNPKRRFFLPVKNNLAEDQTGLAYNIEGLELEQTDEGKPIHTSRIMWEAATINEDIDAIASRAGLTFEERGDLEDAKNFLADALRDGPAKAKEVKSAAKSNGLAENTLRRAQKLLGIKPYREGGFGKFGTWYWKLPRVSDEPQPTDDHDTGR